MQTKYLLTGASGNLGERVVQELLARGADIRALVLPGDKTAGHLPENIEKTTGDILDREALDRFFTVPEGTGIVVIHMAAIVTTCPEFVQKVYDVNVTGTRNIVELCAAHKVGKLVYVSSSSAIPELPEGRVIREVGNFDPRQVVGFYAKTKSEATQLVLDAVRTEGLDASVVFPTAICGPGNYALGYMTRLLIAAGNGKLPAGVAGGFDAVDVRDVARGIIIAAEKGRPGEGYILGNRFISVREILHTIYVQTGVRDVKLMAPSWLALAALPFFGAYYRLGNKPPVVTRFALYNLTRNNNYTSEKARRELGYSVRPLHETIADTLQWLRLEGRIRKGPRRRS